jgi:anti-anti-sigma factor
MALNKPTANASETRFGCSVPMTIDIEQRGEVCILHCKGRFVAGLDLEFIRKKLDDIKERNCSRVLVDFQAVPVIGSAGLGFLVSVYTSIVKNSSGRFVLVGVVPTVSHVLELTRLNTVIPLANDIASGLNALQR